MNSSPIIQCQNLTRVFKVPQRRPGLWGGFKDLFDLKSEERVAVDHLDLSINQGEFIGFIGKNGAGKSTSIKMMTGILTPTTGEVNILGYDPHRQRRHYVHHIGVVFGQRTQLWWDLALRESFDLLRRIYDVPPADFEKRMNKFSQLFDLDPLMAQPVRKLSLGQRMRADLAASLIHGPKILFLDEPTIGLDVVAKRSMRRQLKTLNEEDQLTIILTTHDLDDIEELCQRIVMIDQGKKIYDGDLDALVERYAPMRQIIFQTSQNIDLKLLNLPDGCQSSQDENGLTVQFPRQLGSGAIVSEVSSKSRLLDLQLSETQIEDIVENIYQAGHVKSVQGGG